ncbi:pentatricopeptide repeat-containing protein At2g15980 [Durio zibethinus]|uniref:Pentatricopeptide repeat-containing protein At2g15980 n=1 Tax=Durio zibethinus TaxID=66656 RepID=A0A6P6AD43_DURZI|nr:pentatricopeptide repeat-containing protein At2g15980 [Durio zibethinus]
MANQILKPHVLSKSPKPLFSLSSFSFSTTSSPLSDQPDQITVVTSILTHQRSKSRWSTVLTLFPSGFTPSQFSQITLRLKNNPHLALRFFLFTKQKSLCNHNLSSYSTMIHILSRARLKTRARELIRVAIRTPGIENEPTHLKLFELLVKTYNECGSAPFVFDLLVKSCLQMKKLDGSIEIVRMLLSTGIRPQVSTCNALIWEVSKCRGANKGYEVYKEVFGGGNGERESNVKRILKVRPNVHTFNALMLCFYREGLLEKVGEVWNEMESLGCVPNGYSYSVLMAAFCEEGKVREAEELWGEMRVKGLEPDIVAYNTMIDGLCKSGEIMRAEELFREMGLNGIEATCVTYENLINGYCKVADIDSAMLIYKDMFRKDFRPQGLTVEVLIRGLCDGGMVLEALEIMKALKELGVCPTGKSYELLIEGLCEERKMEEALKLQAEMVGKGFKPNLGLYDAFIDGYLRQGNEEMVTMLRKEALETQKRAAEELDVYCSTSWSRPV